MKLHEEDLNSLLSANNSPFFIPPFQRSYAWGKSELRRFFSDISRLLKSELGDQQPKQEHFFGTLVVKSESISIATNNIIIVDGQQRITTSLIFIIALRDTLPLTEEEKLILNKSYLYSSNSDYEHGIKLKQVTADWDCYKAIVRGEKAPRGKITNAYNFFCNELQSYLGDHPEVSFNNFINVLGRVNLAVIILANDPWKGEDPQIIFETLNSLGKALTLADLIRNYVLLELDSAKQTEVYDQLWYPKIEAELDPLSKDSKETSNFFRDFIQYKLSQSTKVVSYDNTKELYDIFKEKVVPLYPEKTALINEMTSIAYLYRVIIDPEYKPLLTSNKTNNNSIKELLIDIFQGINSDPFKSFVLTLLVSHQGLLGENTLSDEILIETLETIQTYLIRRRLCGLSGLENKNIPALCKEVPLIAASQTNLLHILLQLPYSLRLPNDIDVETKLRTLPFYKDLSKYAKLILGKMEKTRTKVSIDYRDPKVTIEHIMPQTLDSYWEKELGANFDEIHKKYLHNIGNLILTEYNFEMSNRPFSVKKEKLTQSSLGYRLDVIDVQQWNEDAIIKHQEWMILLFLETFPLPNEYRRTNNWNEKVVDTEVINLPLSNSDAKTVVTSRKPKSISIEGSIYSKRSFKDLYFAFLLHLKKNHRGRYEELVTDNTTPLKTKFKRPKVLNWLDNSIKDSIPRFEERYSLVDGTDISKITSSYTGDRRLAFLNNCSAGVFMETMKAISEYFDIPLDEIVINLQSKQ